LGISLETYSRIKDDEVHINGELFHQHTGDQPFMRSLYRLMGVTHPKFFKMDALSQLGFLGSEMTLIRSKMEQYENDEIAILFSNRSSSLPTDFQYNKTLKSGIASPSLFVYTLPNIEVGEICIRHKLYGENNFFISERFDAKLLLDQCEALFQDNATKAVLIGWTEISEDKQDGFFAFITPSGDKEITAETLTDIYLKR